MRSRPDIKVVLAAARWTSRRTGIVVVVGVLLVSVLGFLVFYNPYDPRSGIPDVVHPAMVGRWKFVDVRPPAFLAERDHARSVMQDLRKFGQAAGFILSLQADGRATVEDGKGTVGGSFVWGWDGRIAHGSRVPMGDEKAELFRFTIELQPDDTLLWRAGPTETDWPWPGTEMIYRRVDR